ncbi:MAG: T9SS type A sorting domain-containing protein, partial [Bacteroidales bacterium]|nr:T9SS type A sorting domain-containing protein [Bacteroidales bacterium]
ILNGATIENAVTAINLWKPDDYTMTGGIVEAYNSTFKNNVMSAHALYYRNFNPIYPTQELDYYGIFTNCSFIIDAQYLGDKTFYKHVDLCHVRGLQFNGCTFSVSHDATNISTWNVGLAAYNAGFYVRPYCPSHTIPCVDADSCRFSGFNWAIGVWAPAQVIDPPVFINGTHFNDNSTGIYINEHDYAVILENYLEAGYVAPYHGNCDFADGVGIDIHESIGFVIEKNKLRKDSLATNGNYAGIRVKNCRTQYDNIYKNNFDGLSYGNYAEGTNRLDPLSDDDGVEYQCNCNSHNAVDFMVQFIGTDTAGAMIRGWQGNQSTSSGNVFSQDTSNVLHFSNRGKSTINYYYCDPCTDEEPVNIFSWKPEFFEKEISNENNCPDHYGGGGHIGLTYEERLVKEESFAQNFSDYNSVSYLYESLIDGGDTETELSNIESAEPDDIWTLRSQLLGHSPHLSQEVLRAMAERTDVFPDEVLLEILSANPDELNRDTLIGFLEQKEDPLPDYMIDILRQAVNGVTYKTILRNELAQYKAAKTQAAQDIIRSILFDTVFNITDYRNWLDNLDNMVADRQIISSYLSENDTNNAVTLLNLLPSLYGLEGKELENYNDYKSLVEMQISWFATGKKMNEPDNTDINILQSIAVNEGSYAGNMARNILTYAGIQNYCYCLPMIDSSYLKYDFISGTNTLPGNEILKISAEPNPAHYYVAFNYELLNENSTGQILISDLNGKGVWQIQVNGKQGQKVWNTTEIDAGVYYYNLISDGFSKGGKIVIQ